LKRTHKVDWLVLFAGFVALLVGSLMIVPAVLDDEGTGAYKDEPERRGFMYPGEVPDNRIGLIVFGIGTALAWTASARAIFRETSKDALDFLTTGVRQSEISDMFELKMPTSRWWRWRLRLWKSSITAIVFVLLYLTTALSYRFDLSETTISRTEHDYISKPLPMLGCNTSMYESLRVYDPFIESAPLNQFPRVVWGFDAPDQYTDGGDNPWYYDSAFSNFWYISQPSDWIEGTVTGPFLSVIRRDGIPAGFGTAPPELSIADSPDCGPLITTCSQCPASSETCTTYCRTYGFSYGTFTMKFGPLSLVPHHEIMNSDINITDHSALPCPVRFDRRFYEVLLADPELHTFGQASLSLYMVARLMQNSTVILDTTVVEELQDLGIMARPGNSLSVDNICDGSTTLNHHYEFPNRHFDPSTLPDGEFTANITAHYHALYIPTAHYVAITCLFIWGILLIMIGLPSRRLIITGSLDQWMSLGADMGKEEMVGNSSGLGAASSRNVWRLRINHGQLEFAEASSDPPLNKIRMDWGATYI
jgi:hypothetical protein